jgi:hypothetical protein
VLIATNKSADGWEERAVLTDFGIAQFEGDPRLTQTGMVMGSPGFTAPERIRGSDATPASDLWSLGATLYAAVEGRGPYENRGGAITTMSAIINEDAPVAPHAGQLAPVIAALLRRDPAARPSASLASRMFAQALPQLAESSEEPPAMAHPPTVRSVYVPPAAAPVASAPVTAPDDARPREKATPVAEEEPAEETPAAEELEQEAPAEEAAEADSEDSAAAAEAAESEPEAELVPVSAAVAEAEPAAEGEAGKAVETAQFQASAPESAAVPVPGPPPADASAAEPKAAAAALLAPDPDSEDDESDSRAADTVIPRKGAAAPQVPGARVSPSAAVPAQPETAKPEPPKPTFTAAKPAERVGPSFSAATPARPATPGRPTPARPATPGRPVPPPSTQRPAYGQSSAAQGYPTPGRGNTTPLPPADGTYRAQGAQYAGPSQTPPDLSRQYQPGTGGGGGRRQDRGQRRQLIWLVVAVIIAAAIGVGTALALNHSGSNGANAGNTGTPGQPTTVPSVADTTTNIHSVDALNNPSTTLPGAGWTTQTVTQAQAGSVAAGFSMDVPPDWKTKQNGLQTDFTGPGDLLVEVDLTEQSTTNMLTAATQVKNASLNRFPGYKQQNLQAVPVRNTEGAFWKFTWKPTAGTQDTVDDIFFAQGTSSGVQDYAIYLRSPSSTFSAKSLPLFEQMLRTFKVVPNNS